jgi:hypothetical protein
VPEALREHSPVRRHVCGHPDVGRCAGVAEGWPILPLKNNSLGCPTLPPGLAVGGDFSRAASNLTDAVHTWLSILGTLLTLFGTAAGALGTYFLAKRYYSTTEEFRSHLLEYPYLAMLLYRDIADGDMKPSDRRQIEKLELTARAAEANPEDTAVSLVGFQLVFIGFALQLFGGLLIVIDVLLPHVG